MKKILFMIPDLSHGGAEKVLVNMVNNIDYEKFDVTLMSIFDHGINKQFLNENVHYKYIFKHVIRGNSYFFRIFSPEFLYKHFINGDFDIVVSYLEGVTARIVSGCKKTNTKTIAWIHTQFTDKNIATQSFRSFEEAKKCYSQFDKIVCVSDSVKKSFETMFEMNGKCEILYNVNETEKIKLLSKENVDFKFDSNYIYICAIGKLELNKGFGRLLKVHKRLLDDGYKVKVIILGTGSEKKRLLNWICKNNLENDFYLLGYKTNPYCYLAHSDLFVCSSYREGFNTATAEALILGIPVLTTEVSGAKEMLGDNDYGIIVNNSDEALYDGLKNFISSKSIQNLYKIQSSKRGKIFSKSTTIKKIEDFLLQI